MVPLEYDSHGHAAVFQFLDSEETPMAIEKSDTVMPTYRNPVRLDIADTAEAGTDVLSRGLNGRVERSIWFPIRRQNWWVKKLRGLQVSEEQEQMMLSLVLRVVMEAQGC